MKNNILVLLLSTAMVWTSCRPEKIKPYNDAGNTGSVASIAGVWRGSSSIQTDNSAVNKNFPYKTLDITQSLKVDQWSLTLNATGNTPATFTLNTGSAPSFFKFTSGKWKVDNVDKSGKLLLINDAGTDTLSFTLGSYQSLLNNKLVLINQRFLLGKPAITYQHTFSK